MFYYFIIVYSFLFVCFKVADSNGSQKLWFFFNIILYNVLMQHNIAYCIHLSSKDTWLNTMKEESFKIRQIAQTHLGMSIHFYGLLQIEQSNARLCLKMLILMNVNSE